jgi:hypothetical protein
LHRRELGERILRHIGAIEGQPHFTIELGAMSCTNTLSTE